MKLKRRVWYIVLDDDYFSRRWFATAKRAFAHASGRPEGTTVHKMFFHKGQRCELTFTKKGTK